MDWYLGVLKKYAVFQGRARRKEFWMFTLFNFLVSLACGIVDGVLGTGGDGSIGLIGGLYALGVMLPSIAVAVRRLHDTGRSGWWILLSFIPIVGWIILIVFYCLDGESQANAYGENPKAAPAPA
jgi:uncharacterized membrane protein YhaH (DUF805 family)